MTTDGIEREYKLRARAPIEAAQVDAVARELGLDLAASAPQPHSDDYLDDADRSLARAGLGLRCRRSEPGCTLGFKSAAEVHDHLLLRREVEAPWSGPMPATASVLPPTLRAEIEPFTLDRPLAVIMQLRCERERRHGILPDGGSCELAIDRVTASADGRSAPFTEVELEVSCDAALARELVQRLCEQLPLAIVVDSKLEHAQTLLGLPLVENGPVELQAALGLGTALRLLLRQHLQGQRREEAGVRLDRDPECLHRMRVANRRMRALARAFPQLWPEADAAWLRQHLGATGRSLGAVRDLDVMLAELTPLATRVPAPLQPQLEPLRARLAAQRAAQLAATREWLEQPSRLGDERRLERLLTDPPQTPADCESTPAALAVMRQLSRAARSVRRVGDQLPAELPIARVHELRVAIKRLRYLLEDFLPVLPAPLHKTARRLARLQQKLGTACDHDLGARYCLELLPTLPGCDPQLAALIGSLATIHTSRGDAARKGAARGWKKASRQRFWNRFESPSAR